LIFAINRLIFTIAAPFAVYTFVTMKTIMENKKTWFVTGASKGLGLALVKKLLAAGYNVAATSRDADALTEAVGVERSGQFLPLKVDLINEHSVCTAIHNANETFGKIDVIVNNAGYGIGGAVEELNTVEIADGIDVNLFGTINVIQKAMPYLRKQRFGHIFNISSIAGFAPGLGFPVYAATKFAVTGLSDALAQDVASMGITVTAVAPGAFRTQFLNNESLVFSANQIADYAEIRQAQEKMLTMDGQQIGDPEKAADALIKVAEHPNPPKQLFLGSDAYKRAAAKIEQLARELEQWKELTLSTDFVS
jgi:NAD(P)-dependent dehydrogenase (short-subunit alcohol dehydrogenase family)